MERLEIKQPESLDNFDEVLKINGKDYSLIRDPLRSKDIYSPLDEPKPL
jgi:hypothetical protein